MISKVAGYATLYPSRRSLALVHGVRFMETLTPKDIVEAYLDASTRHDYQRVRACLADEVFSMSIPSTDFSPPMNWLLTPSWRRPLCSGWRCARLSPMATMSAIFLKSLTRSRKEFQYAGVMGACRGARIKRMEMIYDAYEYKKLFVMED